MFVIHPVLKNLVQPVLDHQRDDNLYPEYKITVTLFNPDNPEFNLKLFRVNAIQIIQDFIDAFTDRIHIHAVVPVIDFLKIIRNYSNLYASIVFTKYNAKKLKEDPINLPIQKTYLVFINNYEDLLKQYNYQELIKLSKQNPDSTEDDDKLVDTHKTPTLEQHVGSLINLELQLIPEKTYYLKNKFYNGIFYNEKVENAIKFIASKFNVPKCKIYQVDNTQPIANLYIPPEYGYFDIIFSYIQAKYGVYKYPLNYYVTNDTLFIYPLDPSLDHMQYHQRAINIVKFPLNVLGDITIKHYLDETTYDYYVIIDSITRTHNFSKTTIEDLGTNYIMFSSDKVLYPVDNKDRNNIKIPEHNLVSFDVTHDYNTIKKKAVIPRYLSPTKNVFELHALLNATRFELIVFEWDKMPLYEILPGDKVFYYYTKGDQVKMKQGIVDSIIIDIVHKKTHDITRGRIAIRCEPEEKAVTQDILDTYIQK